MSSSLWQTFKKTTFWSEGLGFGLDVSRIKFAENFFAQHAAAVQAAFKAMSELESGAIANPDEQRMVGHYWLRTPELAPAEFRPSIEQALTQIEQFSAAVHSGQIAPAPGQKFNSLLLVGIGGSALGPQFVNTALRSATDPLKLFYFDNTDPDGMNLALRSLPSLAHTLCVVVSKSGGTKETRNGEFVARAAFAAAGLNFSKHMVAITCAGSELDQRATKDGYLARFPMWDWVGGRTSELSAVGLLPAALQGFNIREMLRGAREIDAATRVADTQKNPAMMLALAWLSASKGVGAKDMVVLPYKDRLELFSKYLQQLVMESLGKKQDLAGKVVHQGLAVYGNKGATDQHAYVQQLRDGVNNFFAVFIEVLKDNAELAAGKEKSATCFDASSFQVEPGVNSGDYLAGFYLGTRTALYEADRESISLTIREVSPYYVGFLIALFERAVGFYASLVNVNAYHQPGVEAGKKAATAVLQAQGKVLAALRDAPGKLLGVSEIAAAAGGIDEETAFKILHRLAAGGRVKTNDLNSAPWERKYGF